MIELESLGAWLKCAFLGHEPHFENMATDTQPALEITCERSGCDYKDVLYGTGIGKQ